MSLTRIEISRSALLNNIAEHRKLIGKTKLMAVVKSNAYGHGIDAVAEVINERVDWFGVVSGEEAIGLRDLGISKPILVLSYYDDDLIQELLRKNISLAVYDAAQIKRIDAAAKKLKTKARIHLKCDTGTTRLGVAPEQLLDLAREIQGQPSLSLEGLFSHLASSEDDPSFTKIQLTRFEQAQESLKRAGIALPITHIACTASANAFPQSRYDLVRLGIGLYGLTSYKAAGRSKTPRPKLIPALSWKTKIIQVKPVPKNTFVGYSGTYKTRQAGLIAVLPVGYNEGYDRKLSNSGEVLISGVRCPVRGRICMNLMMVDVTKAPEAKVGDEAVLIGRQGELEITADELAKKIGTINYEIVTRLNSSIPRIIIT